MSAFGDSTRVRMSVGAGTPLAAIIVVVTFGTVLGLTSEAPRGIATIRAEIAKAPATGRMKLLVTQLRVRR